MGFFNLFKQKKIVKQNAMETPVVIAPTDETNTQTSPETNTLTSDIISVEQRIGEGIPSKNGLYPHQILAISYASTFEIEKTDFQSFWLYRYGVADVKSLLVDLESRGFIRKGSASESLESLKSSELKSILKDAGLKQSGKKAEQISRIRQEINENDLERIVKKRYYVPTSLGKQELKRNEYIPYFHSHSNTFTTDIWQANRILGADPTDWRNRVWQMMGKSSLRDFKRGDFGFYRNTQLLRSTFLEEESRYTDALFFLLDVCWCDLNNCVNNFNPEHLEYHTGGCFPYEKSNLKLAPGVIKSISDLSKEMGYAPDDLKSFFSSLEPRVSQMPMKIFTFEECVSMIMMALSDNEAGIVDIFNLAEKRFWEKYPKPIKLPFDPVVVPLELHDSKGN